jgi:hypothetical protein
LLYEIKPQKNIPPFFICRAIAASEFLHPGLVFLF